MKINERILEIFKEFKIHSADGICYLLSIYYGYTPSFIPDDLKAKVNATGIITSELGILQWNVPLFKGQETNFDWVEKEYISLFEEANPSKRGNVRSAIARMKELFAKNPDIRKEEVIGATVIYIANSNPEYIRQSHYFIKKGRGVAMTQDILEWIDRYRTVMKDTSEDRSVTRRLR